MVKSTNFVAQQGGTSREVILAVGSSYRVQPISSRAARHRGRVCTIISFNSLLPTKVRVRFEDDGRQGVVKSADLIEQTSSIEPSEVIAETGSGRSDPSLRMPTR